MRRLVPLTFLALLAPVSAAAQTLTVDVEATGVEPIEAEATVEAHVRVGREEPALPAPAPRSLEGAPPVVVVVPPLEDTPRPRVTAPAPAVGPAPPPPIAAVAPAPVAVVAAPPSVEEDDEDDLQAASHLAMTVEWMDLSGLDLDFHDPEIGFLDGMRLSPGFVGQGDLRSMVTMGGSLGVGMRAEHVLRGPELRLQFGGAQVDDVQFHPLPGAPDGIEAAVTQSFFFRVEAVMGVQVELGPLVPYALARAAVGGVWVDVDIRDRGLGDLGTETVDGTLLQLGLEAGAEIRLDDGLHLGAAFRGSFLGTPSYGGALTVAWVGPEEDS